MMKKKRKLYLSLIIYIILGGMLTGIYTYHAKKSEEHNFLFAVQEGNIPKVKEYLKSNKDINKVRNRNGGTALHVAVANNKLEIAKLLISNGLNPNLGNSGDDTALIWAIQNNNYQMVKFLMDSGVPATQQVARIMPAIHFAAQWGDVDIIKLLIERGADVNRISRRMKTVLSPKDIKNNTIMTDITPLCIAVSKDHLEAVKLLLKLGAKIDKNSLLFASQNKDKTILKFLQAMEIERNRSK